METILSLKCWEKREFFTWIPALLHGSQKKLFRTLVVPFPFVCMLRPHLSIQNAWQQNFCRIKWFRTSNNMQHIPHFWKLWSASVSSNVISYQHWRKFQMFFLSKYRLWFLLRITNYFWSTSKSSVFIVSAFFALCIESMWHDPKRERK